MHASRRATQDTDAHETYGHSRIARTDASPSSTNYAFVVDPFVFGHLPTKLRMLRLFYFSLSPRANMQINKLICKSGPMCVLDMHPYSWDTFPLTECRIANWPQETLGDETCVCAHQIVIDGWDMREPAEIKRRHVPRPESIFNCSMGAFISIHHHVECNTECNGIIRRASINYSSDKNCPTFELINLHFILPFQLKRTHNSHATCAKLFLWHSRIVSFRYCCYYCYYGNYCFSRWCDNWQNQTSRQKMWRTRRKKQRRRAPSIASKRKKT